MGRGNVCTFGKYEGLYYIDNHDFHVYRDSEDTGDYPESRLMRDLDLDELCGDRWHYDEIGTMCELDDIEESFMEDFTKRFPSFDRADQGKWLTTLIHGCDRRRIILESGLFYICIEDNEWSLAVELIQKKEVYDRSWMQNLQGRLYEKYLDGMKECLLNRLPSIGFRTSAWTSGTIRKEEQ